MNIKSLRKKASWAVEESSISSMPSLKKRMRLGVNLSKEEIREGHESSLKIFQGFQSKSVRFASSSSGMTAFDMRENNHVTEVRDQGDCGSCVAFGTLSAVEATYLMQEQSDEEIDFSEADLFFCGGAGEASCGTGWQIHSALNVLQSQGVVDEDEFPYDPHRESCRLPDNEDRELTITGYQKLNSIPEMEEWISTKGALVTAFAVYDDFFWYKGGVYEYTEGELLAYHAVAVVGFDSAEQCWICKNSWGTYWGDSGFFQIRYGQCDIEGWMYGIEGVEVGGGKKLAGEFKQFTNSKKASGGRFRAGSFFKRGRRASAVAEEEAEESRLSRYVPIQRGRAGEIWFETERDLQEYCLQVLESKGHRPEEEVWVSEGLRADIVCDRTIYECKKVFTRDSLYQALGQGTSYLAAMPHCNRLVLVGQLPYGEDASKIARSTAGHLERVNRNLTISFIEEDPFWELDRGFFGFQRWRIGAALVGGILLTLTAKQALLIAFHWLTVTPFEITFRFLLYAVVVFGIFYVGLRSRRFPRWERRRWW